jgi:hypothetical protein
MPSLSHSSLFYNPHNIGCPTASNNPEDHHFRNTLLQILSKHINTILYEFIICFIINICPHLWYPIIS